MRHAVPIGAVSVPGVRDSSIDPKREPTPTPAELDAQLTRAYLSGDGVAVERIMALIAASQSREPAEV